LCREFYRELGSEFQWNDKPYEYEFHKLAIDLINGTDKVRHWVEKNGSVSDLIKIEKIGHDDYLNKRAKVLLYL
jgi:hypothetical protein